MVKRIAEVQLRKEDGESHAEEAGTWKEADPEEISKRRIVKARRPRAPNSAPAAATVPAATISATSPPFSAPSASTSLFSGLATSPQPTAAAISTPSSSSTSGLFAGLKSDPPAPPAVTATAAAGKDEDKQGDSSGDGEKEKEKEKKEEEKEEKKETETGKDNSESKKEDKDKDTIGFMAHIPKTNPFASLAAASAQSKIPLFSSFGGVADSSGDGKGEEKTDKGKDTSTTATDKQDKGSSSIPLFQFAATPVVPALFSESDDKKKKEKEKEDGKEEGGEGKGKGKGKDSSDAKDADADGEADVDAIVKTGEEDEECLVQIRSKLFILKEGWHERGVGMVHINLNKTQKRHRIVMRREGNFGLILNAVLFSGMSVSRVNEKNIRIVCVDHETSGLATFLLRVSRKEEGDALEKVLDDALKVEAD